ncbi:MAG: phosphohistidine phosphatase SixA [Desulfobacterales bacterium]|jgi:phosphohistidine phosphatase
MAIYLVQHGKNEPKDVDPEKGLSREGRAEVERIANVAAGYEVVVDRIFHSGKKRALQTAEIMAAALAPRHGVDARKGIDPLDDVASVAGQLDPSTNIMLVGHLPFMERLAAYLVSGTADRPVFKFQNGGIVCIDRHDDGDFWVIRWTLMPNIG